MRGSSGFIKNFCANRVIGLLILPLVYTGSHRDFSSYGRFLIDGRFSSCMFFQLCAILLLETVRDFTHSVFYVVYVCRCIPYPSRGRKHSWVYPDCFSRSDASHTPLGDGNLSSSTYVASSHQDASPTPSRGRKHHIIALEETHFDASPTPHGDGNDRCKDFIPFWRRMHPLPLTGTETANATPPLNPSARCIPYPSRGRKLGVAIPGLPVP